MGLAWHGAWGRALAPQAPRSPPAASPPLPRNQDGPSPGTCPAETIQPGPWRWGWVNPPEPCASRLTDGDGFPCLPVATAACSVSVQKEGSQVLDLGGSSRQG